MQATAKKTILRIELWHIILLAALIGTLGRTNYLDPTALVAGGVFMGINFLLLGYGVAWVLTPLAGKGRVKAGVSLLVVKVAIFLGLLSTLFFHFQIDAVSFAAGFLTLVVAIIAETIRANFRLGTQ
jgi:hypothetical protein